MYYEKKLQRKTSFVRSVKDTFLKTNIFFNDNYVTVYSNRIIEIQYKRMFVDNNLKNPHCSLSEPLDFLLSSPNLLVVGALQMQFQ